MGNIRYRIGRKELLNGNAGDFEDVAHFKCVLVQFGSPFLAQNPTTMAGFTGLLPLTDSEDIEVEDVTISEDTVRDRIYVTASNPEFTGLTPTEIVAGLIIYRWVTNFAASIPYYGIGLGQPYEIPITGLYTFPFNADGIIAI